MSKSTAAAEPSMEDILASIRKIITDDEPAKPAGGVVPEDEIDEMAAAMAAEASQPSVAEPEDEMAAAMAEMAAEPAAVELAVEEEEDVFELTDDMVAEPVAEPAPAAAIADIDEDDIIFEEVEEAEPAPVFAQREEVPVFSNPAPPYVAPYIAPQQPQASIISPDVNAAVSSQFNNLSNLILSNSSRTLEDLIQDIMKPMLKSWLDQNLPNLVERVVREEIERVTRGRR